MVHIYMFRHTRWLLDKSCFTGKRYQRTDLYARSRKLSSIMKINNWLNTGEDSMILIHNRFIDIQYGWSGIGKSVVINGQVLLIMH